MKQRTLHVVVCGMVLLAGQNAWACLNDSDSEAAEREFRSRYDRPAPVSRAGQVSTAAVATAGIGGLLNLGAIALMLRRSRSNAAGVEDKTAQAAEAES